MRPLDSVCRRHALHGLGVHVGNDVFRDDLRRLAVGRPGIAGKVPAFGCGAERQHDRVFLPQLVAFPHLGGTDREALLRHPPLLVDFLAVEPAQEVLRGFLVLTVAHDHVGKRHMPAELAGRPLWQRGVEHVVLERLAILGLIRVGLLLGLDIDRSAIVGGAYRPGEEGAVVAGIVPRKGALVAASFHKPTANLTDSMVPGLFSTTVLPSASTSLPPHDQRYGYQKALASPKACATVWPSGCPFAFSFLPASRHSSQVCGYFSAS